MFKIYVLSASLLFLFAESSGQNMPAMNSSSPYSITANEQTFTGRDTITNIESDSLDRPGSHFEVGFGVGNKIYSSHNNFVNSQQSNPVVSLMPAIGYFHKSGLSLTATGFLVSDSNKFRAVQYSIMPAFETGPDAVFDFTFSYTYYIIADKYSAYASPIQHDLYTSLIYKKYWLQPGIALGYSAGKSYANYYFDTIVNNINKHVYDSTTNKVKLFSTMLTVQHSFEWGSLLTKSDKFEFTPTVLLNFGSSNDKVNNKINYPNLFKRIVKKNKLAKLGSGSTSFTLESASIGFDASYEIGQFTIEPQVILDYYVPSTTENRLTYIYEINLRYSF